MEIKKITASVDGIEIELTAEQVEEWCRKKREQENPFARRGFGEEFYYITRYLSVSKGKESVTAGEHLMFLSGNYCADKNLMQQRAYWMQLEQLLWRESWLKNKGRTEYGSVYEIKFDRLGNVYNVFESPKRDRGFSPVFYNYDDAYSAIETIVKPFCKEHPDFRP